MAKERGWLGSARLVGVCTLLSRLLGLGRDIAMAAFFGAGVTMDAFVLAFMIPNLFRRLFGEGAMHAVFIPVFTEYSENKGEAAAGRFFRAGFTALLALLAAITAVGWALSLAAPRWLELNPTWQLVFPLLATLFPFMPLVCLTALAAAALNVRGHFFGPAFGPTLLNLFWIAGLLAGGSTLGIWSVAFAILAGGVAQLVWVLVLLPKHGVSPGLAWEPLHPGVRRSASLLVPVIAGLAVMQVNVVIDGLIAQFCVPGTGANSALYFANRLVQFPIGVIGVALLTAIFPAMSNAKARGEDEEFLEVLRQGLRVGLFIMLPVTAVTLGLAEPIVELIFQRGRFGGEPTLRAAAALRLYSLGLGAYCSTSILTRAFYAHQDTRTPVKVATAMVALNFTLNIILVWPLREAGLALATSVSSFGNACVLLLILRRRAGALGLRRILPTLWRTGLVAAATWLAAWLALSALPAQAHRLLRVGAPMAVAGLAGLGLAALLKMPELRETLGSLAQRRRRKG